MPRRVFLPDAAFGPEMLLRGRRRTCARVLAGWLTRFAAAPSPMPLTRAGACVAVDGRSISLVPSFGRSGLRAATAGAGSAFEWRLDAASAQRFAALSMSLADRHSEAGHHHLDGDADQEITVRPSLNEHPSDLPAGGG